MDAMSRLKTHFHAAWKWVLSFRSHDWDLGDYPVSFREQETGPDSAYEENPRFKLNPWVASITNWHLSGSGNSRAEAFDELLAVFANAKANLAKEDKPLPRPGTKVPIQFAAHEKVNAHPDLAQDFIERVLEFEWAFISDESSLWHFHSDQDNRAFIEKIRNVYSVDVSDIESAKLWEILDRIAEEQKSTCR